MNIEKDFVWNEKDGYAVLEKYAKKYKNPKELKEGEEPEVKETVINIPAEHDGLPVKEVFDAAFATNQIIEEVNFPDCVEKIGCMMFNQSPNLKKVRLSKNLKRLGFFALNETPVKDNRENWRDNMFIWDGWFIACDDDSESIDIPSDVVGIADYAFYFNKKLKKIIIPETVKYIGLRAFAFELDLDEVVIPATVEEAHWNIFGSNVHIKKLVIPQVIYEKQKTGENVKIDETVLI